MTSIERALPMLLRWSQPRIGFIRMGEQHPPTGITWGALNGKKVVQLTDKIFEGANIWPSFGIKKAHTQRTLIVAQSQSNQRGTFLLARRKLLPPQLLEQITQHLWIDKRLIAAYHRHRNSLEVGWFDVADERITVESRLLASTFTRSASGTWPRVLTAKDFCRQRPAWILGIDHNAQTRCQSKQRTSQFHSIARSKVQVGQHKPACQRRILLKLLLAESFNQQNDAVAVSRLSMEAQLWRLPHKFAYPTALDGRIVDNNDWD